MDKVTKPLMYVAGPYSSDPVGGTREAVYAGDEVYTRGWLPMVPHLSMVYDLVSKERHDYEFWMSIDLAMLNRCDALVRVPGASSGADREVAFALEHGIPVYYGVEQVPEAEGNVGVGRLY